jgi:hypothetical protein
MTLGAIDQFELPRAGYSMSTVLNVGGTIVPQWYADSTESVDLDMGRGLLDRDGHNRQVHINALVGSDLVKITLRTQLSVRIAGMSAVPDALARLHDESNATFEAMITDYVRNKIMGGKTP